MLYNFFLSLVVITSIIHDSIFPVLPDSTTRNEIQISVCKFY